MLRSSVEWRKWGKQDPFWAAATWSGRAKGSGNPWTPEDFYDYGRVLWEQYRQLWERYGLVHGTVVDLGCGPGRMSMQLASDFREVIGVDVSDGMVETARKYVKAGNARFVVYDGGVLPLESGSIDGFFSLLVLLHLDGEPAITAVLVEVARTLKPGGSAMLQIPAIVWPAEGEIRRGHEELRKLRNGWRRVRNAVGSALGRGVMQVHDYDARWLIALCESVGLGDSCVTAVRHNDGLRTFLFARKPITPPGAST